MDEIILAMLQVDLGEQYADESRLAYLRQNINAARDLIQREGIRLEDCAEDIQLVEMYAAYLIRKRASSEGMPRMLRWAMNNRLFGQKGKVLDAT